MKRDKSKIDDLPPSESSDKREDYPANNIIFIGKRESKGQSVDAEAPRSITTVGKTYELPEDQSKGFYHEDAAQIVRLFPKLYKPLKAKGAK